MINKPNVGLVCSHVKRASIIKKILKQDDLYNFCFDCRQNENLEFHLKECPADVLIIDFRNVLQLGVELRIINSIISKIIIISSSTEKELLIPASYLMFSVVDIKDAENSLPLAVEATVQGNHFFSQTLHLLFVESRSFFAPPSSFGLSKAHIETLNSYLEGGSIKEMAHRIFLSEATVKKHLSDIREKLKLASNNQIIDFLRKHHWCDYKTGKLICF
tara:strand:- start:168 stop:821 length:654 start_codon:yes stop_codon:yes gene_type:complete